MNEYSYSEYAVAVRQTGKMRAKQIAVIGATAVSLVLALMVYWAFLVLTVAGAAGCYLAYLSSDMEYETIYLWPGIIWAGKKRPFVWERSQEIFPLRRKDVHAVS